jgi:hypothetical protein
MAGIGYTDIERICDEHSNLESLDVAGSDRGSVRVCGKLRPVGQADRGDALIAFEAATRGLVDALDAAGWHCVETRVDVSMGTNADARWAGHYQLGLARVRRD